MSILFGPNGAETGHPSEGSLAGAAAVSTAAARTGQYAWRANPTGTGVGYLTWVLALYQTVYVRFYLYAATRPAAGDEQVASYRRYASGKNGASDVLYSVNLSATGTLNLYGLAQTRLATGSTVIPLTTWTRVDFRYAKGGTVEVRINGVAEFTLTDPNSYGTGAFAGSDFFLGRFSSAAPFNNGHSVDVAFDDVLAYDTAYPPDGGVLFLPAAGVGYYDAWTGPVTVANANVAVTDADKVAAAGHVPGGSAYQLQNGNTSNQSFTCASCPAGTVNVAGPAGYGSSNSTLTVSTRNGTTDTAAGTKANYSGRFLFATATAPSGGAWTPAVLNATQVVAQVSGPTGYLQGFGLMVDYTATAQAAASGAAFLMSW